jgi:FkbM family methyltransferase
MNNGYEMKHDNPIPFYIGDKSPVHDKTFVNELDNEIKILIQYDTKRTCCIDIGANEGYFAVSMSTSYKNIHAFEPISHNYNFLKRNTLPYKNIILHRLAISNKTEEFLMVADMPLTSFNSGMCSRFDTYLNCLMSNRKFPDHMKPQLKKEILDRYSTVMVNAVTVDSLNLEPSLIKIDVEGDEPKVLEGAKNTIEKHKPVVYLERNFDPDRKPLDDYMLSVGYKQVPEHQWIYINNEDND